MDLACVQLTQSRFAGYTEISATYGIEYWLAKSIEHNRSDLSPSDVDTLTNVSALVDLYNAFVYAPLVPAKEMLEFRVWRAFINQNGDIYHPYTHVDEFKARSAVMPKTYSATYDVAQTRETDRKVSRSIRNTMDVLAEGGVNQGLG